MTSCPACGAELGDGVRFCGQCGASVAPQEAAPGSAESQQSKSYVTVNLRGVPPAAPTSGYAPSAPPVPAAKKRSIFWPVLGALIVFFFVIPIVAFVGCAGCASCGVAGVVSTAKQTHTPALGPSVVATVGTGQPGVISSGGQSITVTIGPPRKTRSADWMDSSPTPKLYRFIVVKVHFTNSGTKSYGAAVDTWCWLTVTGNTKAVVQPDSLDDTQGSIGDGRIDLEPGHSATWNATFLVRKTAKPVSFTYQGPGNRKVTCTF